nr:RNA polymerase sigma factor [Mangrovibacter sp. MFB070]
MSEVKGGSGSTSRLVAALMACRGRLQAFIRGRLRGAADVEDIWQEIAYQLIRVEQPVENVAAWLFRAARNEMTDQGRKKRELPFSGLAIQGDESEFAEDELAETLFGVPQTPEDEYLKALLWDELAAALDELPQIQREVFEKTELGGYSYQALAEETGVSVQALLSRKHKAVLYLRIRLQEFWGDLSADSRENRGKKS